MNVDIDNIIKVDTVDEYTHLLNLPHSRHPLLSVCRLSEAVNFKPLSSHVQMNLYCIVIKDGTTCTAQYGWRDYDFTRGAMSFFAPGQIHHWSKPVDNGSRWGWLIAFHPDFVAHSPLGQKLRKLKFFSYATNEALHISDTERQYVENVLKAIEDEYTQRMDEHTQGIIVSQIDVLMNYAERFYTRQFLTRGSVETDFADRVLEIIMAHIDRGDNVTPAIVAEKMDMTTHYLSGMLRSTTGKTTRQYIQEQLIEKAKQQLATTSLSVNEVAYALGFEYPQYFCRLFKSRTGKTPSEWRKSRA